MLGSTQFEVADVIVLLEVYSQNIEAGSKFDLKLVLPSNNKLQTPAIIFKTELY